MKAQRSPQTHVSSVPMTPTPAETPMFDAMQTASASGERLLRLHQEAIRFVNQRFNANLATLQRLGESKSLPEFLDCQREWLAEAAQAYGEEWSRCAELMAGAAIKTSSKKADAEVIR